MPSTVITLGLTLGGDVASFEAEREALSSTLMQALKCHTPSCLLEVRVAAAGSVNVEVLRTTPQPTNQPPHPHPHLPAPTRTRTRTLTLTQVVLTIPEPSSEVGESSTASSVEAAAFAMIAQPAAALSTSLGVPVVAVDPSLQVANGVLVAIVVAPPPPTAPQPAPPASPSSAEPTAAITLAGIAGGGP